MNWPSARSSRANPPRSTVKRAPESRAAPEKSISPSFSPRSKCSCGFSIAGGAPTRRSSTLCFSSGPSGTSSAGGLGRVVSRRSSSAPAVRSSSSTSGSRALMVATSA